LATGLVDHADRSEPVVRQRRHGRRHMALQQVPRGLMVPLGSDQKLLMRPHGRAASQGDRLDALARQVRQQAATVRVKMGGRPLLAKAAAKAHPKACESWPQTGNFLFGHRVSSQ